MQKATGGSYQHTCSLLALWTIGRGWPPKAHQCARNNVSRLTKNVNIPVKARDILWNGTQSARPSLNHHMGARQCMGVDEVVAAQRGWSILGTTDKALTNGENRSQGKDVNPHSGRATCLFDDGWQWSL